MARPSPSPRSAADLPAQREILRMLRRVCANLRQMQSRAETIRAYREIEALLAAEEKRLGARAPKKIAPHT